jgi:hypothetical protein
MDPANISWLESDPDDSYWETYHRRGNSEGDRNTDSSEVSDMSRYYEEIGDDLRRRERMAEAMYEC